jgi:hypothetical protein
MFPQGLQHRNAMLQIVSIRCADDVHLRVDISR